MPRHRLDPRWTASSERWEHGLPDWIFIGAALWATMLGILSLLQGGSTLGGVLEVTLVVTAVAPWWVRSAAGSTSLAAAAFTFLPAAALALTGTTPICLGLLALGAARWAVFGALWTSLVYGLAAAGVVVLRAQLDPDTAWFVWKSYIELGIALGWALRASRLRVLRERDNAALLAHRAVSEERCRIARDVHDALAHSLSVMLLQLNGAQMLIVDDPEEAREALDEAISEGRRSLDEVRAVVGLLGPTESVALSGSADAVSRLEQLVASYQRAGLDVAFESSVQPPRDSHTSVARVAVWSAVYRIAQESLANAVRHAPGEPVRVEVVTDDHVANLRVTNRFEGGLDPSTGNGVAGMSERVSLLGGSFSCGANGQEWVVDCSLPLDPGRTSHRELALSRR